VSGLASQQTEALLGLAIEAALLAGAELLERFEHDRIEGVSSKSTPTDLVSEADFVSERTISELLAARRPHDGFLGEEGDSATGESGLQWVVDPLDGTVNFLFGIPHWSVSVALVDSRGALAGAIYDPCRGELFSACREGEPTLESVPPAVPLRAGTARTHARSRLQASGRRELATAMVATGFAYDAQLRAAQAQALATLLPAVRDIRRFGSAALDLAWTAAGRYDAYFERGVKPWDIAAGALICERAGLGVHALPERRGLPRGLLVAGEALCGELLELLER
jgi:myo-inositol-1(or 4)-monophosphatase